MTGATSGNPFQFTGRENDGTGLYYYRARYYSPSRSRFLSEDPIGFDAGDPNLYAYVLNSPTNLVDPSGEAGRIPPFVKKCVVGLIKAIAKIAGADLAKRKPDIDPDDLLDAAKGCGGGGSGSSSNKHGNRTLNDPLPRNPKKPSQADPHAPDPASAGYPHTTVGTRTDPKASPAPYKQGITYDANGNPVGRTDVTNHGRGDHPNPHWHPYDPTIPNRFDPGNPGNFGRQQPMPNRSH